VADMYHDKVITKVRSNLDSTMVAAVHGQPHRELNGIKGAKSARGVCRVNTPGLTFATLTAVPTESAAGQVAR